MALLVRKADQWFLCLLPAILLAAVFWFGYAVPQRNHLGSMEREMERLGTVDALTARHAALATERDALRKPRPAAQGQPGAPAQALPGLPAGSPAVAQSAVRNVFRQCNLHLLGEALKTETARNRSGRHQWTLAVSGSYADLRQAIRQLAGDEYAELTVEAVLWRAVQPGVSNAVWQITLAL